MPKFLLTVNLMIVVSLAVLTRTVFLTSPDYLLNRITFFLFLAIFLISSVSELLFLILDHRTKDNTQRVLFRRILRNTAAPCLVLVVGSFLKSVNLLNPVNLILLLLLGLLSFIYIAR